MVDVSNSVFTIIFIQDPLIENISSFLSDIQDKYTVISKSVEFFRNLDIDELSSYSSFDLQDHLTNVTTLLQEMKQKIKSLQERGSLPKNAEATISRVYSVFGQLEKDDIKEKIQHLKNRINTIIQEEQKSELRNSQDANQPSSQIKIVNLEREHEVLARRKKQLNEMKQTAGEIKELTEEFKKDVFEQGDLIEQVERDIIEVQKNTKNADNEISVAKQVAAKNRKCFYVVGIIGIIVIIVIVVCVVYMTVFKKKKE